MLATWPMVIGALAAGVIAGLLVPSPKQPVASGSQASLGQSVEKTQTKTERERPPSVAKESAQPVAEAKPEKQTAEACSRQSWPYYSPSCLDRTATAPGPVRIVNTKPANSTLALSDEKERKSQAAAPPPAPKSETRQQTQEAAVAPAQTQTNRARENSRPSSNEFNRQTEQERLRQQPRGQARITRVEPPEDWDDEAPRVFLRSDGTRVYVVPETRQVRPPNGYWRSW
jgi:hypothetical protein